MPHIAQHSFLLKQKQTMSSLTSQQQALLMAGVIADCAIALTGGRGLNGRVPPAHPDEFSNSIKALRLAAETYNDFIFKMSQEQKESIGTEWKPCMKLPVVVHVREQRPDEKHISTREGITPVQKDDLIMLGVQGEEYPIGRELFNQTYRLVND